MVSTIRGETIICTSALVGLIAGLYFQSYAVGIFMVLIGLCLALFVPLKSADGDSVAFRKSLRDSKGR